MKTLLQLLIGVSFCSLALADGSYELPFTSVRSMGMGGAGTATEINNPAAIARNPAVIGFAEKESFVLGGNLTYFRQGLVSQGLREGTNGETIDGGNTEPVRNVSPPVPEVGKTWLTDDGIRIGLALTAPYGTNIEYDREWNGRYHAVNTDIVGAAAHAAIAWQASSQWSFGVGLTLQSLLATFGQSVDLGSIVQRRINDEAGSDIVNPSCNANNENDLPGKYDFYNEFDLKGLNIVGSIGAMFRWGEANNNIIAVSYRAATDLDLHGNAVRERNDWNANDFRNDGCFNGAQIALAAQGRSFEEEVVQPALAASSNTGTRTTFSLPRSAELGIQLAIDKGWNAYFRANWTNWADQKRLRFRYDNGAEDTIQPQNLSNVVAYAVGTEYQLNDQLTLRGGVGYSGSTVSAETRTARGADGARTTVSGGLSWRRNEGCTIDLAGGYIKVNSGEYEDSNTTVNDGNVLRGQFNTSEVFYTGVRFSAASFADTFKRCLL